MCPTVISVKPDQDYFLILQFSNGEIGRFDVKPYLDKGIFQELKDISKFHSVHTDGLSVCVVLKKVYQNFIKSYYNLTICFYS